MLNRFSGRRSKEGRSASGVHPFNVKVMNRQKLNRCCGPHQLVAKGSMYQCTVCHGVMTEADKYFYEAGIVHGRKKV